jgi:hypothetical protein
VFEMVDIWDQDIASIGCFGVDYFQLTQVLENGFLYYAITSMKSLHVHPMVENVP